VTGYVVPDGEPEVLANRLIALLMDPTLSQRMGEQGGRLAQAYSWEIIASQIHAFYSNLLTDVSSASPQTGPGLSSF